MFKVIVITALVVTIMGAAGVAIYDNSKAEPVAAQNSMVASADTPAIDLNNDTSSTQSQDVTSTTVDIASTTTSTMTTQPQGVGDPWNANGVVTNVDNLGFDLMLDDGGKAVYVYVELGPSNYWQAQGVTLAVGNYVNVQGFAQDGMYHAAVVTQADGMQIIVRDTVSGQPLWSGGATAGQNQTGTASAQPQVTADQWVTLEGVVAASGQNSLSVTLTDGATLTTQLGRPSFAAEQNVIFTVGDQVRIIGYDSNGQFQTGEIDNLTQNTRLMLRDPNGRPLWAGPGGNTQSAQGNGQSQGGQGQHGQGNSQNGGQAQNSGGGQGNGYRGGRSS